MREALRLYAEFSARAPDTLNTDAALITMPDGNHGFAISAFYAGPMDEAERVLQPLRQAIPPVTDRIAPISYVQMQKAGDASFPRGHRFYWKAQFLREITEAAADALIDRFPSVPSPRSFSFSNRSAVPSAEFRRQQLPTRTVMRLTTAFLFQSGAIRPQTRRTSRGPVKCTPFFGPLGWVVCT